MLENATEPTRQTGEPAARRRDVRHVVAIPLIVLALALVGIGVAQLIRNDATPAGPEVGGQQVNRDGTTTAPPTTVVIGDDSGLDVTGDQGQVGLLPPRTEER